VIVDATGFTCRSARSAGITALLSALVLVETAVVHVLLLRVRVVAYLVSGLSLSAIAWLVADYRAMGRVAIRIDGDALRVQVGHRLNATIPVAAVARALAPTWQDVGASAPAFVNPTKPATPNVLLVFTAPQIVEIVGMVRRPIRRLALHLDEPDAFLSAVQRVITTARMGGGELV
jgi:hypothetical protein